MTVSQGVTTREWLELRMFNAIAKGDSVHERDEADYRYLYGDAAYQQALTQARADAGLLPN